MPLLLFAVTIGGFLLAVGYFAYTSIRSGELIARCAIPGESVFDLEPALSPVKVAAYLGPAVGPRSPVHLEIEREGSVLWVGDVFAEQARDLLDDAVQVHRFVVDTPGRYRLRGVSASRDNPRGGGMAAIHVYGRAPQPSGLVYALAGVMLAGGFVSLLFVLA